MRPTLTCGALISACLLLSGAAHWVSAYQLTSQHLGTAPSRDNEHLLLFKLPETISSQLLEMQQRPQQQQQQNVLTTATISHSRPTPANQFSQLAASPSNQPQIESEPSAQEQAVSLTIPLLSTLSQAEESTLQQAPGSYLLSAARPVSDVRAQATQVQQNRHLAIESAIIEYLSEANDQQPQQQQQEATGVIGRASLRREPYLLLSSDHQKNVSASTLSGQLAEAEQLALSSAARQPSDDQVAQYGNPSASAPSALRDSQHSLGSQLQLIVDDHTKASKESELTGYQSQYQQQHPQKQQQQQQQQPKLWRDTQIFSQSQHNGTGDFPSLVAKLASGSPDLLIRLKNLLKKTSYSPAVSPAASDRPTSSSIYEHLKQNVVNETLHPLGGRAKQVSGLNGYQDNEYLAANNVNPRELKQLIQNFFDLRQEAYSPKSEGDESPHNPLKALLANSNVTSHEEIKIPLILIAVPRILSFRRNNTDLGSSTAHASNTTGLPRISSALLHRLAAQLPLLVAANLAQNNTLTPNGNNSNKVTSGTLLAGYQPSQLTHANAATNGARFYWTSNQQPAQANAYSNNYVQVASTTPTPLHAMTPYAQQFYNPQLASVPLVRHFIPMLTGPSDAPLNSDNQMPNVVKQFLSQTDRNVNATATGAASVAYPSGGALSNATNEGQQNAAGNLGLQIKLVGANHAASDGQQDKQQSLPFYDVQQTHEPTDEPQDLSRRSINPTFGRSPTKNTYEEPGTHLRPPYDQPRSSQPLYDGHRRQPHTSQESGARFNGRSDPLAARLSLMEEQVSKLRPLFQAEKRSTPTSNPLRESKLSPSQLLSLFSRSSNAKKSWSSRILELDSDHQDGTRTSHSRGLGSFPDSKSPKTKEAEEFESLQELYQRLVEVTQNELELKEELLPYQPEVVDYIVEQITHMNSVINRAKGRMSAFCIEQHKIELERFSYLINTYLRTRVKKIETNAPYLIKLLRTDIDRALKFLSPLEAKYLDRYNESVDSYMKEIIKNMPENMQRFRLASLKQPKRTRYAFVQGLEECTITDGDAEIQLEPDECRILTVSTIIDLLEKGSRQFKLI